MLKPLPNFHDKEDCDDEASSDSDDEDIGAIGNSDRNYGQNELLSDTLGTSISQSNQTSRSHRCDQSTIESNTRQNSFQFDNKIDCIHSGAISQKYTTPMNPAAAIDIMDFDSTSHSYSQESFKYSQFIPIIESQSTTSFQSFSTAEEKLLDDLMVHIASISPTVLVRYSSFLIVPRFYCHLHIQFTSCYY